MIPMSVCSASGSTPSLVSTTVPAAAAGGPAGGVRRRRRRHDRAVDLVGRPATNAATAVARSRTRSGSSSPASTASIDRSVVGATARWHLEVDTGAGRRHTVVHPAPVGHDQAVEPPLGPQDVVQEPFAVADVLTVDEVVRRHHRPRVRLGDGDLEAAQVQLAQRALVDDHVAHHAVRLVIVGHVVLQAGADALGLDAANHAGREVTGEHGSSERYSKLRPPPGCRLMFIPGPSRRATPSARHSRPSAAPTRSSSAGSQLAARFDAVGKHVAGTESPMPEVIGVVRLAAQAVRTVGQRHRRQPQLVDRLRRPESVARQQRDEPFERKLAQPRTQGRWRRSASRCDRRCGTRRPV